jgi:3-phosphoshikimate 1-carboxyvinyltransferase
MGGSLRFVKTTESGGEPIADIAAKRSALKGLRIGGGMIPRAIDEIPVLALLATQAQGQTVISGAQELRVKESDRLSTLREELSKLGARISETPDGLIIDGPTPLKGAVVNSHGDHRLAMTLAIAALIAEGPTTIEDVDCVATSFPTFWTLLDSIRSRA